MTPDHCQRLSAWPRRLGAAAIGTALTLPLAAQAPAPPPAPGLIAKGAIVLNGPHGPESGTITVAAAGGSYCKITVRIGSAVDRRRYTAVLNPGGWDLTGPVGLLAAAPLPARRRIGCALLLKLHS